MAEAIPVYLEKGQRRVFAGAIEWPGWCRSARDEASALEALVTYGARYADAVRRAQRGFEPPSDVSQLKVVQRLKGDATTDFGAPGLAPKHDADEIDARELERLTALMDAAWTTFDAAAKKAQGLELRKGPRGGGRELDAIVDHVYAADEAYLRKLGGRAAKGADMKALRCEIREVFSKRAGGADPPRIPRSGKLWTPRYFARRSAWHALDHAWEIEDRVKR
jgi:hypothetical protein